MSIVLLIVGLVVLVAGAEGLVRGAARSSLSWGISPLVVGLTIVALGTSAPEMAVSVGAAANGTTDLAVDNLVGSNIFNILVCLGLAGVVAPRGLPISEAVLNFDLWVMVATLLACLPIFMSGRKIARWEGGVLLAYRSAASHV
jgi:cation:H+ antiporter